MTVGEEDFSWLDEILAIPLPHFQDVRNHVEEAKRAVGEQESDATNCSWPVPRPPDPAQQSSCYNTGYNTGYQTGECSGEYAIGDLVGDKNLKIALGAGLRIQGRTPEEIQQRVQKVLTRRREAARRSREKKRSTLDSLEQENKRLKAENEELRQRIKRLVELDTVTGVKTDESVTTDYSVNTVNAQHGAADIESFFEFPDGFDDVSAVNGKCGQADIESFFECLASGF